MFVIENRNFHKAVYIICKVSSVIFKLAVLLLLSWVAWSMFEVCLHNITMFDATPYQCSDINIFELLV